MRKTYIRITAIICALILIVVLLCSFLLTIVLVSKVRGVYSSNAYSTIFPANVYYGPDAFNDPQNVSIVFDTGLLYDDFYPDIGRYKTLKYYKSGLYDEPVEVEPVPGTEKDSNYLGFKKSDDITDIPADVVRDGKIYRVYGDLDQTFEFSRISEIATIFIYDKDGNIYRQPYKVSNAPSGEKDSKREKLDAEAEAIYNEQIDKLKRGDPDIPGYKNSWFTDYGFTLTKEPIPDTEIYAESCGVYIYHPIKIVFANYGYLYILIAVLAAVAVSGTVIVMRGLYFNRLSYEARNRNLTRSFAHELKTPLAVTKVYIENWDLIDESERPEVAAKINAEVDHMAKMVSTLLNLSKMDSGNAALNLEDVELFELTKACYRHMEQIAKERGMTVEFKKDSEDGEYIVPADLDMMKMVISNFLSNAIKYGKEKVEVNFLSDSNNVTFKITNDGEAISAKEQKKIWDLFYKTDKSGTDRLESNGVGLAVNKSILELHKARFGVTSGEDGTTFWFEIKKVKE